jgi:hypothetical protein
MLTCIRSKPRPQPHWQPIAAPSADRRRPWTSEHTACCGLWASLHRRRAAADWAYAFTVERRQLAQIFTWWICCCQHFPKLQLIFCLVFSRRLGYSLVSHYPLFNADCCSAFIPVGSVRALLVPSSNFHSLPVTHLGPSGIRDLGGTKM